MTTKLSNYTSTFTQPVFAQPPAADLAALSQRLGCTSSDSDTSSDSEVSTPPCGSPVATHSKEVISTPVKIFERQVKEITPDRSLMSAERKILAGCTQSL